MRPIDTAFTRFGHWTCEPCTRGEHALCVVHEQHWDGRGCECPCTPGAEQQERCERSC